MLFAGGRASCSPAQSQLDDAAIVGRFDVFKKHPEKQHNDFDVHCGNLNSAQISESATFQPQAR